MRTLRLLIALTLLGRAGWGDLVPPAPPIQAHAAILVQAQSGAVLYQKRALEARPPASLTKMITGLVVVQRCSLDSVATVSARAAKVEGSGIGLAVGDRMTVGELLKALMLPSANDAAVCLAEHVAGSEAAFAELMNAKAVELGAVNTHFTNASGLTAEGHYSCARDLAVFGLAVRLDSYLGELVRLPATTVRWCNGRTQRVPNLNRLVGHYRGCDGVKTGFTTPAGRCLAASAQRDGYGLMCVVLKSPDSWSESAALLDWGFAQPPVAVVETHNPRVELPSRLPSPIVEGRLHVPFDRFMVALGCQRETDGAPLTAPPNGSGLRLSPTLGLLTESAERPPTGITWRGQLAVPAAELCRLLGLKLTFNKQTLTAIVAAPTVSAE